MYDYRVAMLFTGNFVIIDRLKIRMYIQTGLSLGSEQSVADRRTGLCAIILEGPSFYKNPSRSALLR